MSKLREYIAYEIEHSEMLIDSVKQEPKYRELRPDAETHSPYFAAVVRFATIIAFEEGRIAALERLRIQCEKELNAVGGPVTGSTP